MTRNLTMWAGVACLLVGPTALFGQTDSGTAVEASIATTSDTVAETSVAPTPVPATVEILPPDESWGGLSRGEWQAQWWQLVLSMPEDVSPWSDATGESCGYGQSGPVFFPVAMIGVHATCVVPEGTAIFVEVATVTCSTVEPPPYFGRNEDELRACANETLNGATDNEASVNGQDVDDLDVYRIATPLFTVALPEDNIIGVEPVVAEVISEGYTFIISPPPPGEYEVRLRRSTTVSRHPVRSP